MDLGMDETSRTLVEVLERRAAAMGDAVAYTFLPDGEGAAADVTYLDLVARARRVGALLRSVTTRGARALLVHSAGLEFVEGFFGCLYAGVIAVPAPPPDAFSASAGARRLAMIAADADATCVLSSQALLTAADLLEDLEPELRRWPWLATDAPASEPHAAAPSVSASPEEMALLQYTSGSTGLPRGVMLSHANLLAQARACHRALGLRRDEIVVSWLPLYHDMGLIGTVLYPLQAGVRSVQMSPGAFLRRPYRWLRAIADYGGTLSVAPNFAYELCCRKVSAAEIAGLDLCRWSVALNGSERVQAETLDRFARTFATAGFRPEALLPCYGLAEASLMVSAGPRGRGAERVRIGSADLRRGRVVVAAHGDQDATTLVACGAVTAGQDVVIVDAETGVPVRAGEVGEIWVSGPCVGGGYWRKPEETVRSFQARGTGVGASTYLRTGDLGFFHEGQLVPVGRLKDLIIVRGVNYVPEDIERTVSAAHPDLRPGGVAAFAVEGDDGEQLVVVQELRVDHGDPAEILARIRMVVVAAHGLHAARIVLVRARSLPKTSSGKMQRSECRQRLLSGGLPVIARWPAEDSTRDGGAAASGGVADEADRSGSVRRIEDWLVMRIAALRDLPSDQIDPEVPFSRYGLDSAEAAILAVDLEDWLHKPLSSELIWNRPTIASLAEAVADGLTAAGDIP